MKEEHGLMRRARRLWWRRSCLAGRRAAGAVIGGTTDTANRYANVGVLQLNVDGEWVDFCSRTLVDADVVLTAAHCTDFLIEEGEDVRPDDLRISFDPEGDAPYCTRWITS